MTHAHQDHADGAARLVAATGAEVLCSASEARLASEETDEELGLTIAKADGGYSPTYTFTHVQVEELADGAQITIGDLAVRTFVTPRHSLASVCYFGGGGRADLPLLR